MGKVKFGLRDFQYAVLGDDDTLVTKEGGIKKIPGITEAKLDVTNELVTISADDGPYVTVSGGITGTQLEVKVLDLTSDARKDFFGITVEKGVEKYNKSLTPNDVACIFRTSMEDGKAVWIGLAKGKFGLPGLEAKTKDGAPSPEPDTVTGNFVGRGEEGDVYFIGREDNSGFKLSDFKKLVFAGVTDISED